MTAEERGPHEAVWKTALALALPAILILIGAAMFRRTISLPFEAGGPLADILAPIAAIGFGIAGLVAASRRRRSQQRRRGIRALFTLEAVVAAIVIVAGLLSLLLIYALCGLYWTRETC